MSKNMHFFSSRIHPTRNHHRNLLSRKSLLPSILSLGATALLIAGCASGGDFNQSSPTAQTAPAFVIGTDAPLPSVTSLSVQIQSLDAVTASGTSVPLLSGSPTVDFARFNGLQTLLDMNDVPVGTYTGVTITLGAGTIGYLNTSGTGAPTIQTENATFTTSTVSIALASPLVVATTGPVGLNVDFNLRKSIQVDSSGNITGTVTPVFNIGAVYTSDSGAYVDEFDAGVISVNQTAQSFQIQGPHGRQFTVNVNGSTEWDNNESLSSLSTSSIVQVSGTLDKADATLDADEVAILSQDGFMAHGQVTYVQPASGPATSFDLYVRAVLPASTGLTLGQIAQVDLTGNENYFIYRMHNPLTQFLFNSSGLLAGQEVSIGGPASGAANSQAVTTKRVALRQWGYNGTVVPGSLNTAQGTFQMQVNGFGGVLIPQTVTVYVASNTAYRGGLTALPTVVSGTNVRVVGILLKAPISGQTVLLARYVDLLN
jgi:Domain of unknown function (DUF4382)/Domain of unknown function (DUF5666)